MFKMIFCPKRNGCKKNEPIKLLEIKKELIHHQGGVSSKVLVAAFFMERQK